MIELCSILFLLCRFFTAFSSIFTLLDQFTDLCKICLTRPFACSVKIDVFWFFYHGVKLQKIGVSLGGIAQCRFFKILDVIDIPHNRDIA